MSLFDRNTLTYIYNEETNIIDGPYYNGQKLKFNGKVNAQMSALNKIKEYFTTNVHFDSPYLTIDELKECLVALEYKKNNSMDLLADGTLIIYIDKPLFPEENRITRVAIRGSDNWGDMYYPEYDEEDVK